MSMLTFSLSAYSQKIDVKALSPSSGDYDNIHIKKISEDSFQSSFVIWVKNEVKPHYHDYHSSSYYNHNKRSPLLEHVFF